MMTARRKNGESGFTLLELMVVIAIIGILATIAVPSFEPAVRKAREATLRQDLFVLRDLIDQYYADKGEYPSSLSALVDETYIRAIPVDPFTKEADWVEIPPMPGPDDDPNAGDGVYDVHSNSDLVAADGTAYNTW
jgi:general secretion pathway protein G